MRLLVFADLHLDAPFAWLAAAGPAGVRVARSRRRALRDCLTAIAALAAEWRVDAVCCAGDLYEQERFTPDTAEFLRETFAGLDPLPVLVAPGNHDWLGPASLYRQVRWSSNVRLFEQDRLEPLELEPGLTLWGAAHHSPAGTRGFLDDFRADRGGVNLALFHGSELGTLPDGKQPHAPFRAAQIGAAGLDHALLGHFHTPRDAADHTYPGNPEPLTFGESGERGAVIVTVGVDGSVARQRHRVAQTEVADVTVDLTGVSHAGQVRDRVAAALADVKGIVRVTLSGELGRGVEFDLADLASVAPHLDALVPRVGALTTAYDFESLVDDRKVAGQFVRDVRAAGLDPDEERRVLITGLRALDGRDDLEVV